MTLSRRQFLKTVAALAAAPADPPGDHRVYLPLVARGESAYAYAVGEQAWAIGNAQIERRIGVVGSGLFGTALLHKASGRDWCSAHGSPVFFLREEDVDLDSSADWAVDSSASNVTGDEAWLTVTLRHMGRPIRVHAHFHVWSDAPIVRAWTAYENAGASARRLQGQSFHSLGLDAVGPLEAAWVAPFSWAPEHTNDSFVLHRETMSGNQERHLVIGPYAADDLGGASPLTYRTSCGWFAFHQPALAAGLFGGVEWSGACDAHLRLDGSGQGSVSVEYWRPAFAHVTAPGETVASPVAFVGLFAGALDDAAHLARDLAERHYIPPRPAIRVPAGAQFPYVMAGTWGYGPNIHETSLRGFVDAAAALGVEVVTIDEGWEARIGDWVSHPARFPSGLRATVDYIHGKGMAAGLWLAFANVDPQSAAALAHPEWLAVRGGSPVVGSFGAQVLCLSHPQARAWVAAEIDRIIAEFDIDWIVQDFETIARCEAIHHGHQPGDSEFRNVQALWELIDGVRARHPNVMIENNWSGGRVMDFGMLRRYDTALCDDYNQAARNRVASFGVTHFFPPTFTSKYMGAEALPLDYQTRSYFFGGPWNLMVDLPAQDAAALAGAVAAYKGLRPFLRGGRVHHLIAPSLSGDASNRYQIAWDAIESVRPDGAWAAILVGRGLGGPGTFTVKPAGLLPDALYSALGSSGTGYGTRAGADWMANGIDVSLAERSHETIVLSGSASSRRTPLTPGRF